MRYGFSMMASEHGHFAPWKAVDDPHPWVIAGPHRAESEDQLLSTARKIAEIPQVVVFRAALWDAPTDPGSSSGAGEDGLRWLRNIKEETSLRTTTEVELPAQVEACLETGVDLLGIGARTTMNPIKVHEIAEALKGCQTPVMVKNPVTAELGLWLGTIEHLLDVGISQVIAVHRGFSVFRETGYRNHPNWQIPIELKLRFPDIPLVCDPSTIAGQRELVAPVSQMALDLGIRGLMIETHNDPDRASSHADRQITPEEIGRILPNLRARVPRTIDPATGRDIERIRSLIDDVDRRIILDLAERFDLVEEIGRVKRDHQIPVLQLARWEDLLNEHLQHAEELGLDSQFIKRIFEIIHTRAVERQL
jgi:chorismate mutase